MNIIRQNVFEAEGFITSRLKNFYEIGFLTDSNPLIGPDELEWGLRFPLKS